MLSDRAVRRHLIAYAVLVSISLLLLALSDTAPLRSVRGGVNYALAPIQEVLAGGARAVGGLFTAFAEIDQLRRENRALQGQVDQLQQQNAQLQSLATENDRLAKLLGTQGTLSHVTQAAFVVARQPSQFERLVTLDRGADARLESGDPVLSDGGALVGVVTEVGPDYSVVRLLSDTRSLVIGMDNATRSTGEVAGNLSAPLEMGRVPGTQRLNVGDRVVTAGDEGGAHSLLPKGLLIGTIVEVQAGPEFIVSSALVQPAADLENLEAVLVITDFQAPDLPDPNAAPAPNVTPVPGPDATLRPRPSGKPRPSKGP